MSMRNHWLNVSSTSLKNDYATGPRGKADEMTLRLYQDDKGESIKVLTVDCFPRTPEGSKEVIVCTRVTNNLTGEIVFYHETTR